MLYDLKEVADLIGKTKSCIWQWISHHHVIDPPQKYHGIYITDKDLNALIKYSKLTAAQKKAFEKKRKEEMKNG